MAALAARLLLAAAPALKPRCQISEPLKARCQVSGPLTPRVLPRHVALIPDGNSRWAERQGLPCRDGHRAGVDSLRTVVQTCAATQGIDTLTVYAFSSENWQRPAVETRWLFDLIQEVLVNECTRLLELGVRCVKFTLEPLEDFA